MSSLQRLILTTDGTTADFKSQCNLAMGGLDAVNSFVDYVAGVTGGNLGGAKLEFQVGAVQASGTITFASTGPTNGQTGTICGVTFTAVNATPGDNEFIRSNTPAVNATNLAAAINASEDLAGIVTASANLAVVTVTCVVPGAIGNGLVMASVNWSNTTVVSFAGGDDGTAYSIDLR